MSAPYIKEHWNKFSAIAHVAAGAIGISPQKWASSHKLKALPSNLPDTPLDRTQVRDICQDTSQSVLFGYLCVMAWGGQGRYGFGSRNAQSAWDEQDKLQSCLTTLRAGNLSRSEAYDLFCGSGKIEGLGPAYLTKLLYFFRPATNFYIMDQWTGKSVNLLTGHQVVRMNGNSAHQDNKGGNYQAYCEEIDEIARLLNLPEDDVEEMLMSGQGKAWRMYVKQEYDYNASKLSEIYPHIAIGTF